MAKNTSFVLGPHFDRFVEKQLRSGRYQSASEVLRAGLRMLETHELEREQKLKALRHALAEGVASGDAGVLDFEKIRAEGRKRAGRAPKSG